MRYGLMLLWMLLCSVTSAAVQVSVGIALPGVSIGINLPAYPELVLVPGYPVYYAPRLAANFFFYDGMYWVYQDDNWYAGYWYNGPWEFVDPEYVPLFILRIPVYYYRQPPVYFRQWRSDAPPRWGEHWGHDWQQRRSGWDHRWSPRAAPAPAPLPLYQRQYSGDRYPQEQQQPLLHKQNYRYQPRDPVVRQRYQEQPGTPEESGSGWQDMPRSNSPLPPQRRGEGMQRSVPSALPQHRGSADQDPQRMLLPGAIPGEQTLPRSHGQGDAQPPKQLKKKGGGKDRERDNTRDQDGHR